MLLYETIGTAYFARMGRDKRFDGLTVWKDGKNISGHIGPFLKRVQAAAVKQAKRKTGSATIYNLKPCDTSHLWGQPIPDARRCTFTHSKGPKAGNRCGRWAMHGAERCPSHGGYRQNPEHPATVRRLADVEMLANKTAARRAIYAARPQDAQHVKDTLTARGLPLSAQAVADGIDALTRNDNGKTWRRYIAQLTRPPTEQRARKPKK